MAACDSGLVTSGTATLQAALAGMPHAVAYKLDQFTWLLAIKVLKPLVMDKDIHVAIANVLAINMEKQGKGTSQRRGREAGSGSIVRNAVARCLYRSCCRTMSLLRTSLHGSCGSGLRSLFEIS